MAGKKKIKDTKPARFTGRKGESKDEYVKRNRAAYEKVRAKAAAKKKVSKSSTDVNKKKKKRPATKKKKK